MTVGAAFGLAPATAQQATGLPQGGLATAPLVIETASGERHAFTVEIADTPPTQRYGMMFRRSLDDDKGMLFVFPDVAPRSFWMENTLIPLDILYIGPDGVIVSIAENAIPLDRTPLPSGAPAQFALEVNGGLSATLGVAPGDRVISPALDAAGAGG